MRRSSLLTPSGLQQLKDEYNKLALNRPAVVQELSRARDLGDRSENAAYKVARSKLSSLDRRMRQLTRILDSAQVASSAPAGVVGLGSKVTLKMGNRIVHYTLVGDFEADPLKGYISYRSPYGNSLMGKRAGDVCHIATPKAMIEVQVMEIQ